MAGPRSATATMARTRDAALAGARRVVAELGFRKASMVDIAVRSGMAKATLYNHFRTKDDIVAALVLHDVNATVQDALTVKDDPAKALARAAWRASTHPALRGALKAEPALVGHILATHATGHSVWEGITQAVQGLLEGCGLTPDRAQTDLVLRWLLSAALLPLREGDNPEVFLEQARALATSVCTSP